jgi:hypothetical protein
VDLCKWEKTKSKPHLHWKISLQEETFYRLHSWSNKSIFSGLCLRHWQNSLLWNFIPWGSVMMNSLTITNITRWRYKIHSYTQWKEWKEETTLEKRQKMKSTSHQSNCEFLCRETRFNYLQYKKERNVNKW